MTLGGKGALLAGLLAGMAMGLLGCSGEKFERNPNLRNLRYSGDYDLFSPVWASNGKIYYLCSYYQDSDTTEEPWDIFTAEAFMSINYDGTGNTLLLGDTVQWDTTPDKFFWLAHHAPSGRIAILQVEGPILIWDIWSDSMVDSVPNPQHRGHYLRWLPDGSGLLLGSVRSDTVWKVSMGDSTYTFYGIDSARGFEVNPDGSLYTDAPWPSFCPVDSQVVVYKSGIWAYHEALFKREDSQDVNLEANPYEYSWYYRWVSWSPVSNDIVFGAGEVGGDPMEPCGLDLWILEDVR